MQEVPLLSKAIPQLVGTEPLKIHLRPLSISLLPAHIFPTLSSLIKHGMSSAYPNAQCGARMALSVTFEGRSEYSTLLGRSSSPDFKTTMPACAAVGCLCEWAVNKCTRTHIALISAIMVLDADPTTHALRATRCSSSYRTLSRATLRCSWSTPQCQGSRHWRDWSTVHPSPPTVLRTNRLAEVLPQPLWLRRAHGTEKYCAGSGCYIRKRCTKKGTPPVLRKYDDTGLPSGRATRASALRLPLLRRHD